ncbi:MAG: FHA domain-containing protein [Planctomycetota bacterium]|jgi:pSer/pThr/pTyr-binding forkhead associated (FHA) protein|nr:FHA domain-containing protein [Planctomycetota bacterium]MDP6941989.1 FHA domain-containing protein [Planctomycetota bacterium]
MKLRHRETGQETKLGGSLLVGRLPECDLKLDDGSISRRHAQVSAQSGSFFVKDLDSSNGVLHNGRRVKECQLHPGDLLTFGVVAFDVVGEEGESESVPTSSPVEASSSDRARERMRAEARSSRRSSGLGDLNQLSGGMQLMVGALSLVFLWGLIQVLRFLI